MHFCTHLHLNLGICKPHKASSHLMNCDVINTACIVIYSKTCLKRPLKENTKNWFSIPILLNAGQKYCRMLQLEHSAILSTFIKLPFSIKTFVLSSFKWPLKTGFTVLSQISIDIQSDILGAGGDENL